MALIFCFLWSICLIFSFAGWGTIINNLLFPDHRFHWAQRITFGTSFCIFAGSILNLTWLISKTSILLLLAPGFLFHIFDLFRNKHSTTDYLSRFHDLYRKDKLLLLCLSLFLFYFSLRYIEAIYSWNLNANDDWKCYFILLKKMLRIGSMGLDPFSVGRASALGGNTFLQASVLSMLSIKNVQFIDRGLGVLLSIGLLSEYSKTRNIPKKMSVFILILFLLLPPMDINTSSLTLAIAFFLSLFNLISWKGLKNNHFSKNSTIIALVASGLCSLKSSYIPTCILFIVLSYTFLLITSSKEKKKEALYEFLLTIFLIGVFLLPWMISMYQSSGTLLFPLLGHGYHGSINSGYLLPYSWVTPGRVFQILLDEMILAKGRPLVFIPLILLLSSLFFTRTWKIVGRNTVLSFSISACIGIVSTFIALDGWASYRVTNAIFMPVIFVLLINAFSGFDNSGKVINLKNRYISIYIALFAAATLLVSFSQSERYDLRIANRYSIIMNLAKTFISRKGDIPFTIVPDRAKNMYQKLQNSIPEGETVLTRLIHPHLLDFKRNPIFSAKAPGSFSPPPGMPFFKGEEKLAEYLISQSVKYVAYAYAQEAGYPKKRYAYRLKLKKYAWPYTVARHNFDFDDNLRRLAATRKVIYADAANFVLDLSQKKNQP